MFCRYCGAYIAEDSLFCAKCGKKLGKRENPRLAKIVQTLRLKTPYPYFALLIVLFITWAAWPKGTRADYSRLKWSFELDKKAEDPAEHSFLQALSLVVENTGPSPVAEIPIELRAKIEPAKRADVEAGFLGRRLLIMQKGYPLPLTVILAGTLPSGAKMRYPMNGNITAEPPFKVTYEVRDEDGASVLATYVAEQQ
jgi:hypothetical protein